MRHRATTTLLSVAVLVGLLGGFTAPVVGEQPGPSLARYSFTESHMGMTWKLIFYAPDSEAANRGARAAFSRVAELNSVMSDYDPTSELSQLVRTAGSGSAVPVSEDLFDVLGQAQALARRTGGAFEKK